MQESSNESLHIAYSGPSVTDGRMAMAPLATGLRGQAALIERVATLLYGDTVAVRVEVDPDFRAGSLVIPVHIVVDGLRAAEGVLSGPGVTAVANLMQLLGFFGVSGATLYKLFKYLKGRRIEKPQDIPPNLVPIITNELLARIYNDPEVQAQIRQVLAPLRENGIDESQTSRNRAVIDQVSKSDLKIADDTEVADLTKDEEVTLDIEKTAWKRNLAWYFDDGHTSFDAKIEDEDFWKRIYQGEAFSDGDRLRVHLRTTASRKKYGKLKVQREIPKVLETEHVKGRQANLFDNRKPN